MEAELRRRSTDLTRLWTVNRLIVLAVSASVTAITVACLLFWMLLTIQDEQEQSRVRTLINRAAICQMHVAQGIELSDDCLSQEVLKYYDPIGTESTTDLVKQSHHMLCNLSILQGLPVAETCGENG